MAPSPPKRRKLDHDSDASADSEASPQRRANGKRSTDASHDGMARTQMTSNGSTRVKAGALGAYAGDLLQLQVEGLCEELAKLRTRRLGAANDHLRRLKTAIEAIPDCSPLSPAEGERLLWTQSKAAVPFPKSRPDKTARYTVSYAKPLRVNVVGSFALDTAFVEKHSIPVIDLAVTIPATLFQDKDYLNYRYFVKRSFYLATIAAGLSINDSLSLVFSYGYQNGNLLQPVLLATPTDSDLKAQYCIRIIVASAADFAHSKTGPTKNCIRSDVGSRSQLATPIYNATLRAECSLEAYLKFMYTTGTTNSSYQKACMLLSVWLRQRGLGSSHEEGGFGSFEASALLALLLHGGGSRGRPLFSGGYSHFQLFKAMLQLITSRDLGQEPLSFNGDQSLAVAKGHDGPIVWDGERGINLCYKMSRSSYLSLRSWARSSLATFDALAVDRFDVLFLRRCDCPEERYDDIFDLKVEESNETAAVLEAEGLDQAIVYANKAFAIFEKGLAGRVASIQFRAVTMKSTWPIRSLRPQKKTIQLRVGLILNAADVHRTVDRGPPAEDKAAAEGFQRLWGEKAELRRFQDSSILESVVWDDDNGASAVHRQVVDHLCGRHLSQKPLYKALDTFARDSSQDFASRSLTRMNDLWRTFEDLQNMVRNLQHLPLQLRNFLPASFCIENESEAGNTTDTMDIALQFEGSGRWPEDLVAIQRTKIAFLAKIQSLLENSSEGFKGQLYHENPSRPFLNCSFLQITSKDTRHVFRIRIFHERESALLSDNLRRASSSLERQAYSDALSIYNKDYVRKPAHAQAIRQLSLRHPSLLPTIMLFRKWCSAHLLEPHLSPEFQNLIVARVFTQPHPFLIPVNVGAAFLRVLRYLSKWDWWHEPLVVDFGDLTTALLKETTTRFEAWRKIDPALNRTVLFAASDLDVDGTTWTQQAPSKVVASRLSALATASINRASLIDLQHAFADIFSTGLGDYDFVIHLSTAAKRLQTRNAFKTGFKNLRLDEADSSSARSGGNAIAAFIEEVAELFSDSVTLFHDRAARPSAMIAGVWNPCEPRSWKTTLGYSARPQRSEDPASQDDKDTLLAMNKAAFLNEVARLGGDLISKIELRES